jgi:Cu/Ag efflux protein CusF
VERFEPATLACVNFSQAREAIVKKFGPIALAIAVSIAIPSAVYAQEGMKGQITNVDELKGTISIKRSPTGTVGSGSEATSIDFKVKDALLFNAVRPGDKVVFTATTENGRLTINKMEKQ